MHWDRLFEDLEGQLASEWEAERAALDAESERLRIAKLDLRSRLREMCAATTDATVDLSGGRRLAVTMQTFGTDWIGASSRNAVGTAVVRSTLLIPHHAIAGITLDHGMMLASLDENPSPEHPLRERMTLGFILRDLARRRVPVDLSPIHGDDLHGTVDRAAADHLDLAVHDAGAARRSGAVRAFHIIPFTAIACVRAAGDQAR